MVKYAYIAESSNGRTHPSGGWYLGSNPSSAASICNLSDHTLSNSPYFLPKVLF